MTIDRSTLTTQKIQQKYIEPRIAFEPNSGCWIWLGHMGTRGYSTASLPQIGSHEWKTTGVARYIHENDGGNVPPGFELHRVCKQECCVNPKHYHVSRPLGNRRFENVWEDRRAITHCPQGHEYAGANVIWRKNRTSRICRSCQRLHEKRSVARRKALEWGAFGELAASLELSEKLSKLPRKYYVYHLIDPITETVFYVGKGCGGRVFQHAKDVGCGYSTNQAKDAKILSILARGVEVEFRIVKQNISEPYALWLEKLEIDRYGIENLTNKSSGSIPDRYRKLIA